MVAFKTATSTLRIDPGLKDALGDGSAQEHRSIANMVEVLIRDHCARNGIAIADGDAPASLPLKSRGGAPDATEPQDNKKGKPS
jgi:hypothetical protein